MFNVSIVFWGEEGGKDEKNTAAECDKHND